MDIEKQVMKYALENAVKFEGKAQNGAVIGKLLSEDPSLKAKMGEIGKKIAQIIADVNKKPLEEQKKLLLELDPDHYEKEKDLKEKRKEARSELPELQGAVEGKVVTRIPPEPSKYPHFGHALSFLINYMYAIKYKGKCILRFEDTNPEKGEQEYVDAVNEDILEYLDVKPDQTVFVSDHIDKYYSMAEQLIEKGNAYTCSCKSEDISKQRRDMKNCKCRKKSIPQIKKDWESMKKGEIDEGSLTLRLKISMDHKNAVMRDPVIFRLWYTNHYTQKRKYNVWPMYDFENAIEEGLLGITHVLRSNEFETRIELQNYIRDLFKLPNPVIRQYARFNITGATTKGREIREKIESGEYIGWDDPRLVTLKALKRRGILKEAYYEMAKVVGMSKTTSNLDFSVIAAINRKLLDKSSKRFFFIEDPKEIKIDGSKQKEIELDLHPEIIHNGRKFKINDEFYVETSDFNKFKPKEIIRLMDCLNFTKEKDTYQFHSYEYDKFKGKGEHIIHWLPKTETIAVEILMPDNTTKKGLGELNIRMLKVGDIIQFERFGFCRLDSIEKTKYKFWFAHK